MIMSRKNTTNEESKRNQSLKRFMRQIKVHTPPTRQRNEEISGKLDVIDEALTHSSAHQTRNYEKLEFLGDAVLRLVASEFIEQNFPAMEVGLRSMLRAHLVSDRWLTKIGRSINIEEVLVIGSKAVGDRFAKNTLNAESTEALIGAIYQYWNSLDAVHNWLEPYWLKESQLFLANPDDFNSKSALQEWCQGRGFDKPNYKSEEKNLNHGSPQRFFCEVYINNQNFGSGWGQSKRDSEQEAARKALQRLKEKNLYKHNSFQK